MDIHTDLRDFSSQCRLFPLPNLVLFPHAILPLHIFEPRYRQMTEDALAGDQLVTIVQVKPMLQGASWTEPVPTMEVGCVGRIVQHERLPDGRFNFLLLGCKRVRLTQELPSPKLYRIAEATVLEDQEPSTGVKARRDELIDRFLTVFEETHRLEPDLSQLLKSGLSLGVLSDIIAHTLDLPASVKQSLLDDVRVDDRVSALFTILQDFLPKEQTLRPFPPPFSVN